MLPQASEKSTAHKGRALPFLLGCAIVLLLIEAFGMHRAHDPARWNDFRAFYSAGYLLRTAPAHLYDLTQQAAVQDALVSHNGVLMPYYHPAFEALLFAPLSLLTFAHAYALFMLLMMLCLVGSFYALRALFSERMPWLQSRPGLLVLCFLPSIASIAWGQDSLLFLLLVCLALRQLQRDRDAVAGCLLALALFRFQLAVPLLLLLGMRRRWPFTASFLATALLLACSMVALTGRSGTAAWLHLLTNASLITDQSGLAQHVMKARPVFMTNLAGLLYALGTRFLAPRLAFACVAAASVALLAWTALRIRRVQDEVAAITMALVCTVLVSYHFLPYDLGILLPAFALLHGRVAARTLVALYWLPLLLFALSGGRALFLYAAPLLALLLYLGNRSRETLPVSVCD